MRVFLFYKDLIFQNQGWIKRISIWAAVWFAAGFFTSIFYPEFLQKLLEMLQEVFKDILKDGQLDFTSTLLIFKNNVLVAALSLFLGAILGLLPLLSIAVNFFILGFLFGIFLLLEPLIFFISIVPHGLIEIPAFILAAAFGARLGLSFQNFKNNLKENLQIFPLLILVFFVAALIEVFVTGNLVRLFEK